MAVPENAPATEPPPRIPFLSFPSTSSSFACKSPGTSSAGSSTPPSVDATPPIGRTAVMVRKKVGSYMKPAEREEDVQYALCCWENCGASIACDRSSVNQHMRRHIRDLHARGLLYVNGRPFRDAPKAKPLAKCQTYCRWRDEVPCPYSDLYQSQSHGALLKKRRKKMQKLFGRNVKKSEWSRNVHFRRPDTTSEDDADDESSGVDKAGQLRGQCNGSLISIQSLIKHICATHLLSLMMTCEECNERFSRTDAYGRHQKEVHEGETRKNH
ncbi:hypothetical protein APHAL10511_000388 [Amanita phalloides]|nr:hypothetical protein APHAL10511_000388 [Amanita phalloides]